MGLVTVTHGTEEPQNCTLSQYVLKQGFVHKCSLLLPKCRLGPSNTLQTLKIKAVLFCYWRCVSDSEMELQLTPSHISGTVLCSTWCLMTALLPCRNLIAVDTDEMKHRFRQVHHHLIFISAETFHPLGLPCRWWTQLLHQTQGHLLSFLFSCYFFRLPEKAAEYITRWH